MDLNSGAAVSSLIPEDEAPDMARLLAVLMQQQEGINMLTKILGEHDARLQKVETENRMLKARTDAPVKRLGFLMPGVH